MNKSPTVSLQQRANNQAERLGFEPRERLPAHRISSAARSTTPASFLVRWAKLQLFCDTRAKSSKKVWGNSEIRGGKWSFAGLFPSWRLNLTI